MGRAEFVVIARMRDDKAAGDESRHGQEQAIRIATWNVNSIRSRLPHVLSWLQTNEPDVLLLQELKGTDFPGAVFDDIGYSSTVVTQKAYNGVAVLSRLPVQVINRSLAGDAEDSHARFLEVIVHGIRIVNIYLPNGNPVGTEKFAYKLAWMDRLHEQMLLWVKQPTIIGGDFNVIPEDIDCYKPSSWIRDALFQPESRARFRGFLELGYRDAFREIHPGLAGQYTFWDYFREAFRHNRGIRIDHFLLSPQLVPYLQGCSIDPQPRTWDKPSDHTPVLLELTDPEQAQALP